MDGRSELVPAARMIQQMLHGDVGDAAVTESVVPRRDAEIGIDGCGGGEFSGADQFVDGGSRQCLGDAGKTEKIIRMDDPGEIGVTPAVALAEHQLAVVHQGQRAGFKIVGDEKVRHGRFQRRKFRHDRAAAGPVGGSAGALQIRDSCTERRAGSCKICECRRFKADRMRNET